MLIANTRRFLGMLGLGFLMTCATPQAGAERVPVAALDAPLQVSLGLQEVATVSGAVFLTAPPGDRNRQFEIARRHLFAGRCHDDFLDPAPDADAAVLG